MVWSFVTTSQDMLWCMWLLIRLQKLLLNFLAWIHLNLQSTGQAPEWLKSQLWEQHHQWAVWAHVHLEGENFAIPPPDQQTGGVSSPNANADDWKLGKDWKADWPMHLLELVHAYNSTSMFGQWSFLPIDFYFPTIVSTENTSMLITMLQTYVSNCVKPSRKCKYSPHLRLKGRGDTMILKLMPFHWNWATWSWLKLMPTKGGERWKTSGRRNHMKWNTELLKVSLPTLWKTSRLDAHESSTRINFFSLPL